MNFFSLPPVSRILQRKSHLAFSHLELEHGHAKGFFFLNLLLLLLTKQWLRVLGRHN